MTKGNFLYCLTGAAVFVVLVFGLTKLFGTLRPADDVLAQIDERYETVATAQFEVGNPKIIVVHNRPIMVWRRDADQIELALQQDDPEQWEVPVSYVSEGKRLVPATDENLTIAREWFIASPINWGGSGCHVIMGAGDYDGFFDPCYGTHFDLAGRYRRGPGGKNLFVVMAELSPDGSQLTLDLSFLPSGRRY